MRQALSKAVLPALLVAALLAAAFLVGCSEDESPPIIIGNDETIETPVRPGGPDVVATGAQSSFTTGGARSTATNPDDHPIEYRFDFDADGTHDYSAWTNAKIALKAWSTLGLKKVRAQARCQIHTDKVSEWSLGRLVEVGLGPNTEITGVISTYFIGGTEHVEALVLTDGIPDTVPYGSWIKVLYRGVASPQGDSLCNDPTNKCLWYQKNYTWVSVRDPDNPRTIAWRPPETEDNNLFGVEDSTSMNIGSLQYTFRTRAYDQFDRADQTPAEVEIVGNFPPILDTQSIENHDGTAVADGDTVLWDWWHPANEPDTIDAFNNEVVRKFYFVVKATGHDDPREANFGVKSWKYSFLLAGSNPDTFAVLGSRAGDFVDGYTVDELADTAMVTFRYSFTGDPGGANVRANLPDYLNKEYIYSVTGRDLSMLDRFDQRMYILGASWLMNSFNTAAYGRWTERREQRFFLKLVD